MPITNADYVLTDKWTDVASQEFMNIYYVRHTSGVQDANDLIGAFRATIHPPLKDILHQNMEPMLTEAHSILDLADFDSEVGGTPGVRPGEAMPNFVAAGFRIIRSNRLWRDSAKRYGRLSEDDVIGNGYTGGAAIRFQALADALMSVWTNGVSTWELMMPKRNLVGGKYLLGDLSRPAGITLPTITTQNTRKR